VTNTFDRASLTSMFAIPVSKSGQCVQSFDLGGQCGSAIQGFLLEEVVIAPVGNLISGARHIGEGISAGFSLVRRVL